MNSIILCVHNLITTKTLKQKYETRDISEFHNLYKTLQQCFKYNKPYHQEIYGYYIFL